LGCKPPTRRLTLAGRGRSSGGTVLPCYTNYRTIKRENEGGRGGEVYRVVISPRPGVRKAVKGDRPSEGAPDNVKKSGKLWGATKVCASATSGAAKGETP